MKLLLQLVAVVLFAGLTYALGTALYLLESVAEFQGTCPAAPTDIPAYTCTVREFSERMVLGPWALFGHLVLGTGWFTACAGAFFVGRAAIARLPGRGRETTRASG